MKRIKAILKKVNRFYYFIALKIIKKRYCKSCQHRVHYIEAFDGYKRSEQGEADNGKNICRVSINFYTNEVGEKLIRPYGTTEICNKCDMIVTDNRKFRYKKCIEKNRDFKCKEFALLNIGHILLIALKAVRDFILGIVTQVNLKHFSLFVIWALFQIYILTFFKEHTTGHIFHLYIILSVIFFVYYIFDNKNKLKG